MQTKVCKKCEIEKDICFFQKDKSKKDGYRNSCKECQREYHKNYYEANRHHINEKNTKWKIENSELLSEMRKQYYEDNREEILEKGKVWARENKEKIRIRKRKHYQKNKSTILHKKKEYIKRRKAQDKLYHLRLNLRCLVKTAFYKKNFDKPKTLEVIGCSYEEFKNYIEIQFTDGMNWENYGEWHLDHKIPVSWATSIEELYKLNHYSNFQPMWAFDNKSKSNRYSSI